MSTQDVQVEHVEHEDERTQEALAPIPAPDYDDDLMLRPAAAQDVIRQVNVIQEIMQSVMQEGEHWGYIVKGGKPSLYKAGAEKLCLTFRLAPRYEIEKRDLPDGHREYETVCNLFHMPTGQFVGSGTGFCSSMESNYRYRKNSITTDVPVPKPYWEDRNPSVLRDALRHSGSEYETIAREAAQANFGTTKEDGRWLIAIYVEGEHPNPADTFNTVKKMSKKRAMVDAVLTATAASDIFTQDIEDMSEFASRETLQAKVLRIAIEKGFDKKDVLDVIGAVYGLTSIDELSDEQAREMLARINRRAQSNETLHTQ